MAALQLERRVLRTDCRGDGEHVPGRRRDADATLRVAVSASNGSSVYATSVSGDAPRSFWRFGGVSGGLVDQQGVANGTSWARRSAASTVC